MNRYHQPANLRNLDDRMKEPPALPTCPIVPMLRVLELAHRDTRDGQRMILEPAAFDTRDLRKHLEECSTCRGIYLNATRVYGRRSPEDPKRLAAGAGDALAPHEAIPAAFAADVAAASEPASLQFPRRFVLDEQIPVTRAAGAGASLHAVKLRFVAAHASGPGPGWGLKLRAKRRDHAGWWVDLMIKMPPGRTRVPGWAREVVCVRMQRLHGITSSEEHDPVQWSCRLDHVRRVGGKNHALISHAYCDTPAAFELQGNLDYVLTIEREPIN